jgi:hypothetical protein
MKAKETKMQTTVTKKTIMLSLLLLASGAACAEWVVAAGTNEYTVYIDPATIRKDGNLRKVWEIHDHNQPKQNGEMSRLVKYEYDCKTERRNLLSISTHAEPIGKGKTIWSPGSAIAIDWREIPPGTDAWAVLNRVCAQ